MLPHVATAFCRILVRNSATFPEIGRKKGADPLRFINLINNEPTIRTLLPLSPTGMEDPEDSDSNERY